MENQEVRRINTITPEEILDKCPGPIISRRKAAELTGGLMGERHLANLDSAGIGPARRVKIGKRAGYESESFAEWLASRIEAK